LIFFPIFGAGIIATTAFLQAEGRSWIGLSVSAALFVAALATMSGVPPTSQAAGFSPAQIGISGGFMLCALTIGLGSLAALALRARLTPGKIAMLSFFGGWIFLKLVALLT
jgi:hypothetical protein